MPRLGAEPAASSSATARHRASRLLLRHGQAAPVASSSATAMCRAGRLPSSAMAGPRRPPSPPPRPGRALATASSPTTRPHAGRFSSSVAAAAGSHIAAEEGSAPLVIGAQSGPMGLMGRRALPCLGPGSTTRGALVSCLGRQLGPVVRHGPARKSTVPV
jgi:hypothetical protein